MVMAQEKHSINADTRGEPRGIIKRSLDGISQNWEYSVPVCLSVREWGIPLYVH